MPTENLVRARCAGLRRPPRPAGALAALLVGLLSACGGGGGSGGAVPDAPAGASYAVGGTVRGLFGSGLVLANGADSVSVPAQAADFRMSTLVASGRSYAVTVSSQPAGLVCAVFGGSGTVAQVDVNSVEVRCQPKWSWVAGQNTPASAGLYGPLGSAGIGYTPSARQYPMGWADRNGNLWLMGGLGPDADGVLGHLSDVWKFDTRSGQWAWVQGAPTQGAAGVHGTQGTASAASHPGARGQGATWVDAAGNLWLFGGVGLDAQGQSGFLNDLWKFNPVTQQWTWISGGVGINAAGVYGRQGTAAAGQGPGARYGAVAWADTAGRLWLFGGLGFGRDAASGGELNDLWSFNPATGLWTWVSGADTPGGRGVPGSLGVAAAANLPGARFAAVGWSSAPADELWLFGGNGLDANGRVGNLNDLWKFSIASGQWTWVAGASSADALGRYGSQGVAAAGNAPGARMDALAWADSAGNLWLMGGFGEAAAAGGSGHLSDVWTFEKSTSRWIWVSGSTLSQQPVVFGTQVANGPAPEPGGRRYGLAWLDSTGGVWLFGGTVVGATSSSAGRYNDLWRY